MYVRTASGKDLAAIRALLVDTWHATYDGIYGAVRVAEITERWHSLPALRDRLSQPNSEFLVADNGKAISGVAFASFDEEAKTVMLHQLYVRPEQHGHGIGGLLMDEVFDCFPDADVFRLEVEEANAAAIGFYEAYGFARAGRTANCGDAQSGIPALILERRRG
jgi:ribosomal protein S18 acetylase RimI-like enzyme